MLLLHLSRIANRHGIELEELLMTNALRGHDPTLGCRPWCAQRTGLLTVYRLAPRFGVNQRASF